MTHQYLLKARAALERLAADSDVSADKFDAIFRDSFADAFRDFADDRSALE